MAKFRISVEGDDQDELKSALEEALTMLGGEAAAGEEETETEEDLTGDDEAEVENESEAQKEECKALILKMTKVKGGPDEIRAALKAVKAAKLVEVDDEKLGALLSKLKVAAKKLKVK